LSTFKLNYISAACTVVLLTDEGQGQDHAPLSIAHGGDLSIVLRELSREKS